MKMTIESTTKIVQLEIGGQRVPARMWEGKTARGIPVVVFVTRVGVLEDDDARELEAELLEQGKPSPTVEAFPARMVWP